MARMRYLKPGYFLNDLLAEIEPLGRLLFAGLWCYADRKGKLEDRPKRLKAEILPYDNCNINKLLQELHNHCFIIRYTVNNDNYIKITNWDKHQSPNIKEQDSIIPEPDEHNTSMIQVSCKNSNSISLTDTDTDTDTEIPPNLIAISKEYHFYQKEQYPKLLKEVTEKLINEGAIELEKLIRIDKHLIDDIEKVLDFVKKDDFWSKQILSLRNIRKKGKNGNTKFENAMIQTPDNKPIPFGFGCEPSGKKGFGF